MVKSKRGDVLSLDKTKQKKVVKRTNKIKKDIKDGKMTVKEDKTKKNNVAQSRGLIYIAHIPHGFYEEAMKNYFKQFGVITNVKVCRSGQTGQSKGYGYVEFHNPEVAKIAAETMNNYLMFKKRIVAEYVPYEKRPKGLFKSKGNTATRYSTKVRREKQIAANAKVTSKTHLRRSKSRLSNFNRKMQKLQDVGIDTNFQPTDIPPEIRQIKAPNEAASSDTHQPDPYDSDIEVMISDKRSKKSLTSSASRITKKITSKSSVKLKPASTTSSSKVLLAKSLDSVKTLLPKASSRFTNLKTTPSPMKVSKATSIPKFKANKKAVNRPKGVVKKSKKDKGLNPDIVEKIARELIRKRGDSLLNVISTPRQKRSQRK